MANCDCAGKLPVCGLAGSMAPIDIVISRTEGSICAAVAEELELAVSELTGGLYEGVPAGGDGARSAVATPSHAPPGDDMRSTGLANAALASDDQQQCAVVKNALSELGNGDDAKELLAAVVVAAAAAANCGGGGGGSTAAAPQRGLDGDQLPTGGGRDHVKVVDYPDMQRMDDRDCVGGNEDRVHGGDVAAGIQALAEDVSVVVDARYTGAPLCQELLLMAVST
ncbi:hypothetical protein EV179_000458 [Coemansia sp. RSA 487]|nr:hypothetical protein EV179_000458 [Coemansia sp. RSA 487]